MKKARALPSIDELKHLFDYDAETGVLTRRWRDDARAQANARFAGKPAGCVNNFGYIQVQIGKQIFLAHRIIWKLFYGNEPPGVLDHINCNPTDNRIANLRAADHTQNAANVPKWSANGLPKGVRVTKEGNFQAQIRTRGRQVCLGTFATADEAASAYRRAAAEIHGGFANP